MAVKVCSVMPQCQINVSFHESLLVYLPFVLSQPYCHGWGLALTVPTPGQLPLSLAGIANESPRETGVTKESLTAATI